MNKLPTILLFMFSSVFVFAQISEENILFKQLIKMDQIVFQQGFNECNLNKLEEVIHPDFEFYHDIGGIQNKKEFLLSMESNICLTPKHKPIRKLVTGTLEVFPLYKQGILYGAIQNGDHEFWIKEPEKELYQTGSAKFSTTWLLIDGEWKMKNVLSFDHSAVK